MSWRSTPRASKALPICPEVKNGAQSAGTGLIAKRIRGMCPKYCDTLPSNVLAIHAPRIKNSSDLPGSKEWRPVGRHRLDCETHSRNVPEILRYLAVECLGDPRRAHQKLFRSARK